MSHYEQIASQLMPQRERLLAHPIYERLEKLDDLRVFMDHHVFAVWDFMCLLKALQRQLTCIGDSWRPTSDASACRLINEIVLCEESDVDQRGRPASHFELYRTSMKAAGASTVRIDLFLDALCGGDSPRRAFGRLDIAHSVRAFVLCTLNLIERGNLCELAGVFAFARENLLPDVFQNIVDRLNQTSDGVLDDFNYYLNRHIEVDGDDHGPMARKMVESICGDDEAQWAAVAAAARDAFDARQRLWDGILVTIDRSESSETVLNHSECNGGSAFPSVNLLEAAVQLGWIDGLSIEEISDQTRISQKDVAEILEQSLPDGNQMGTENGRKRESFETNTSMHD